MMISGSAARRNSSLSCGHGPDASAAILRRPADSRISCACVPHPALYPVSAPKSKAALFDGRSLVTGGFCRGVTWQTAASLSIAVQISASEPVATISVRIPRSWNWRKVGAGVMVEASTRSGSSARTVSASGCMPPRIRGTFSGAAQNGVTAANDSPAPSSITIAVRLGARLTMRAGGADCAAQTKQANPEKQTAILRMTGQVKGFRATPTEELSRYEKTRSLLLSVSFTIS